MRMQRSRGNVFVGNLPPNFDDEQLAQAFDPYGIVLSASVARDPANGKRLRYGFVDIATERAAQAAVSAMNGTAIDGHALDVRISERRKAADKKPARANPAARRPRAPAEAQPAPRPQGNGRIAAEPPDGGGERDAGRSFAPRPPRKQPSFVVERRPLPRRIRAD